MGRIALAILGEASMLLKQSFVYKLVFWEFLALKLLLLASGRSKQVVNAAFDGLGTSHDLHVEWLDAVRQRNLSMVIGSLPIKRFDRVLVWLPFKCLSAQIHTLRKLPKLVVFDSLLHEQASIAIDSQKQYLKFCKALPWARFVVFGQKCRGWLKNQGVDAHSLPPVPEQLFLEKATNLKPVTSKGAAHKITGVCFLGNADSPEYKQHKEFLYEVRRELKIRTVEDNTSLEEKRRVLDESVMCFVDESPFDGVRGIALDAFAAGCLVLLWPADHKECTELGLADMENVALVDSKEALVAKVNYLQRHKDQAAKIASSGQKWLASLKTQVNNGLESVIEPSLGQYTGDNAWSNLKYLFYK